MKILNVPLYVNEEQLKHQLNLLLNNSIVSLYISNDPADNSIGIAFIKFTSVAAKNECLNLYEEKKYIFTR